jgi:hypothetical protein
LENLKEKPLGRPRRRWEVNIRMDVWERGWNVVGWMHPVQDGDQWWALAKKVMNFRVP